MYLLSFSKKILPEKIGKVSPSTWLCFKSQFCRIFLASQKSIPSLRGKYSCVQLNSTYNDVLDVFLQKKFIRKKFAKMSPSTWLSQKSIVSNFAGSLKSILSVPSIYPCTALNSASDHVFDIFVQWISTFKKI